MSGQQQSYGRGPDPLALALRAWADAVLEAKTEEQRLERVADNLRTAQSKLAAAGVTHVEVEFGRMMRAALDVQAGKAFWDREQPEPVPQELAR